MRGSASRRSRRIVTLGVVALALLAAAPAYADVGSSPATDTSGATQASAPSLPTTVAVSLTATATATSSQTDATNSVYTVSVGQPTTTGAVAQQNDTTATSTATTGTSVPGSVAAAAGATAAGATAVASQVGATSIAVSVRVASPGDNGAVAQTNNAAASAGATTDATAATTPPATTATATQTDPTNINVSVRVASPGDNGAVTQTNAVTASTPTTTATDPTTATDAGTAAATQTGARNINVTVRVGSPGSDDPVLQSNSCVVAKTGKGVGPIGCVQSDGMNTNVLIILPADPKGVVIPTGSDPWLWNWTWKSGAKPKSDSAPTSSGTWTWSWTAPGTPAAAPSSTSAATPGSFSWGWTLKQGNGKTTKLSQTEACDCSWDWNWSWDWSSGDPSSVGHSSSKSDAAPVDTSTPPPAITQTNTADAQAAAAVTGNVSQVATPDVAGTTQSTQSTQTAHASATATQSHVTNTVRNGSGGVVQSNKSIAHASSRVVGTISQSAGHGSSAAQLGAQTAVNRQRASSTASSSQRGTSNDVRASSASIKQTNRVFAQAVATTTGSIVQSIDGTSPAAAGAGAPGTTTDWAFNDQSATAVAKASQSNRQNFVQGGGGTLVQSNDVMRSADAAVDRSIVQVGGWGDPAQRLTNVQALTDVASTGNLGSACACTASAPPDAAAGSGAWSATPLGHAVASLVTPMRHADRWTGGVEGAIAVSRPLTVAHFHLQQPDAGAAAPPRATISPFTAPGGTDGLSRPTASAAPSAPGPASAPSHSSDGTASSPGGGGLGGVPGTGLVVLLAGAFALFALLRRGRRLVQLTTPFRELVDFAFAERPG